MILGVLFVLLPLISVSSGLELEPNRTLIRRKRTIFYHDQDALILLMIVFPYRFPFWDRFVATQKISGLQEALSEFPTPITSRRLKRWAIHFDEQISYWIVEVVCAYMTPIIPNNIYKLESETGTNLKWVKRDLTSQIDAKPQYESRAPYDFDFQQKLPPYQKIVYKKVIPNDEESIVQKGNQTRLHLHPTTFVVNSVCYLLDLVFDGDEEQQFVSFRPYYAWILNRICSFSNERNEESLGNDYSFTTIVDKFCFCVKRRHVKHL